MSLFNRLLLLSFLLRAALHFLPAPSITPPPTTACQKPGNSRPKPPVVREVPRPHKLCVYGATGFTGELVAKYLSQHPDLPENFSWCIAGRSKKKLENIKEELDRASADVKNWRGAPPPELVVVDSSDAGGLAAFASSTDVILTTVGPYANYGLPLVAACAAAGTHYADLSGEFFFQRKAMDLHGAAAVTSGAKILVAAGYDSVPFDLGADLALSKLGLTSGTTELTTVSSVVTECHGSASGGTIASAAGGVREMIEGVWNGEMTMEYANDPYILIPEASELGEAERGCTVVDTEATGFGSLPRFDRVFGHVSVPHFMAYVNSRVVRRSQHLNRPNARLSYSESMTVWSLIDAMFWSLPHWFSGDIPLLPAAGSGPGPNAQKTGGFKIKVKASNSKGTVELEGVGSGDPGYAHTSRLLSEVGLCLLDEGCRGANGGGILTVASGTRSEKLRERLEKAKGQDGEPLLVYKEVKSAREEQEL